MKTNRRMADLLAASAGAPQTELPWRFQTLVNGGFKDVEGCVFFRDFFHHDRADGMFLYGDATGYECAVNRLRLSDYLERDAPQEPIALAATVAVCANFLAERLRRFSTDTFRIIASVRGDGTGTLRFHRLRVGATWVVDDLKLYEEEAVLVLDSRG